MVLGQWLDPVKTASAHKNLRILIFSTLTAAARQAALDVEDEARKAGHLPKDYRTTLLICAARKVEGHWFIFSFGVGVGVGVGDGGMAAFDVRDGALTTLSEPDSGEFVGQTRFLELSEFSGGYEAVQSRIFFDVRKDFTALALMTDGVTDPKFPTENAFADPELWRRFWEEDLDEGIRSPYGAPEDLKAQLTAWIGFRAKTHHDDRTMVLLLPKLES